MKHKFYLNNQIRIEMNISFVIFQKSKTSNSVYGNIPINNNFNCQLFHLKVINSYIKL